MRPICAGLIGLGFRDYSDGIVRGIVDRVQHDIEKAGIRLHGGGIICDNAREQITKVADRLRGKDVDVLILCVTSWLSAAAVMALLRELDNRPVLIYSIGGKIENDVLISAAAGAGAAAILEPMRAAGMNLKYVCEPPAGETRVEDILAYGSVCRTVRELKRTRLGIMGYGDMGLYTTTFDASVIQNRFGAEVVSFDMLEVENEIKRIPRAKVEEVAEQLRTEWEFVGGSPSDASLDRVAEIYLALQKIVTKRQLQAVSIKCVEGMSKHMACTPCVPAVLLSDKIPYVCECDVPTLLSQVALRYLTSRTTSYLETYDFFDDRILMGACGFLTPSMSEGAKRLRVVSNDLFMGLASCSSMRPGRMTMARLFSRGDRYSMHIVTGEGVTPRPWKELGYDLPSHPSLEVIPDCGMERFLQHIPAQHYAVCYGDYEERLVDFCRLLDVDVVG